MKVKHIKIKDKSEKLLEKLNSLEKKLKKAKARHERNGKYDNSLKESYEDAIKEISHAQEMVDKIHKKGFFVRNILYNEVIKDYENIYNNIYDGSLRFIGESHTKQKSGYLEEKAMAKVLHKKDPKPNECSTSNLKIGKPLPETPIEAAIREENEKKKSEEKDLYKILNNARSTLTSLYKRRWESKNKDVNLEKQIADLEGLSSKILNTINKKTFYHRIAPKSLQNRHINKRKYEKYEKEFNEIKQQIDRVNESQLNNNKGKKTMVEESNISDNQSNINAPSTSSPVHTNSNSIKAVNAKGKEKENENNSYIGIVTVIDGDKFFDACADLDEQFQKYGKGLKQNANYLNELYDSQERIIKQPSPKPSRRRQSIKK